MAQIFLTGATGFVGRHLVSALRQAGHNVHSLIRATNRAQELRARGCQVSVGDLREPQLRVSNVDVIIHLASVHRGKREFLRRINAEGTAKLVAAAERASVKKFLYLSTLTASPRPHWPYAHSMWLAEQAIQQSSLDYLILRCPIIVGRGDPFLEGIIKMAQHWPVMPIIGSGGTKFQLIDVRDVARCLLQAVQAERFSPKLLSIGGPEALSYEEMVDRVLAALHLRKRKLHLPRRATRWLVGQLERLGVRTPFVPGHFLARHHTAHSLTVIEENFGFTPTKLYDTLKALLPESFAS